MELLGELYKASLVLLGVVGFITLATGTILFFRIMRDLED